MDQIRPNNDKDFCKKAVEQVENIKRPCIQIQPVFPFTKDEWGKFFYLTSSTVKQIEGAMDTPFLMSITESSETPKKFVECPNGVNGDHEIVEFESPKIGRNLICIHCGKIFIKSSKSTEEIKKFMKGEN